MNDKDGRSEGAERDSIAFELPTFLKVSRTGNTDKHKRPSRTESIRTQPNRTEENGVETNRSEPSRSEPSRTKPSRPEPTRTESIRTELNRVDPNRVKPSRTDPIRTKSSRSQPTQIDPTLPRNRIDPWSDPTRHGHKKKTYHKPTPTYPKYRLQGADFAL